MQLASAARAHMVDLTARIPLLAGAAEQTFINIDSLLRPVFGHARQGASYQLAGEQVLRPPGPTRNAGPCSPATALGKPVTQSYPKAPSPTKSS